MRDRVFFALAGLATAVLVGLALVWPQGLGARSPAPFGHSLGPVENEPAASRKPLRRRTPADVSPGALTAPIPAGGRPETSSPAAQP